MKHLEGDGSPLKLPLYSLGLSQEFADAAMAHGYTSLADFQYLSISELLTFDWFTASMFRELTTTLKKLHKLVSS